ncbi:metallophosphoesterase [Mycoplasmoides pneumoniae]|uniref:metallophosphoesterase n=1 Tax=Mycoplasmoides pneumoniae TaxID=2104 RepID=UPI00071B06F8|nr:metallophosphoesterase [Mycoplasmoides pneumoniae]QHR04389.1 metallophosphoesterase [Mycoplasmoides pneumoniae]QHR06501.1 metallophosphoesterase [Mycoplasmoides pneumoniae]QHR12103.1 metallophosphoesterase [Mycoplasmoides pneumoniae]QHR14893.1 metallophosphoesterase [Mycoplasmoides pneumoniae]QHR16995.1 metallophosphoesterase [Mycoplasmoides pneumoniae]
MTKVLVLSDTHGYNDRWLAVMKLHNPDVVIHAGDHLTTKKFMDQNATFWVAGNHDVVGEEIQMFELEGIQFVLMHGHQAPRHDLKQWYKMLVDQAKSYLCDVLIVGHSHIEHYETIDGIQVINPGSLEIPRNPRKLPTYCNLNLSQGRISDLTFHFLRD